jgi:hypothetical protein
MAIAAGMILNAYISYRSKRLGMYGLMFWCGVWISLVFVSLLPVDEWYLQRITGVTTFNTMLVVVIVILFAFIYRLSVQIHRLSGKVTEIVRTMALEEKETEKPAKKRKRRSKH